MELFSHFLRRKTGRQAKAAIKAWDTWKRRHFPGSEASRYRNYITEANERKPLTNVKIPLKRQTQNNNSFLNDLIAAFATPPNESLPEYLVRFFGQIDAEISGFLENLAKYTQIQDKIKDISLMAEIEALFVRKLQQLLNELQFCRYDRMGETEYFYKFHVRFYRIHADLQTLNGYCGDYLYAIFNTEYVACNDDLERIRINVEAMRETVDQFTNA